MNSFDRPYEELMDLRGGAISPHPFPHIVKDDFFAGDFYRALKESYPAEPVDSKGTGFALYEGEPGYSELMQGCSAWERLYDFIHSKCLLDYAFGVFGETLRQENCLVDIAHARYVDFVESREQKMERHLKETGLDPADIWTRLDIYLARVGYGFERHVDRRRRIVTALIYFCDREETKMVGGELVLHSRNGRVEDIRVEPRNNRMVMFACSPGSWHSVPTIQSINAPRKHIQLHISRAQDAWER